MTRTVSAFPSSEVEAVQALQRGLERNGETIQVSTDYNESIPEQVLLFILNESTTNHIKTSFVSITVRIASGDRDRGDEIITRLEEVSSSLSAFSSSIKASAFTEVPQRIPQEARQEATYSGTLRLTIIGNLKTIHL